MGSGGPDPQQGCHKRHTRNTHPTLDASLVHDTRTDMPEEYRIALEDGTHMSQAEHDCLPRGLLDDEQDEDRRQHMAVVVPPTLIKRPIVPVTKLSISSIYSTLSATEFDTPRVFDPAAGEAARHLHLFNDVDQHHPQPVRALWAIA